MDVREKYQKPPNFSSWRFIVRRWLYYDSERRVSFSERKKVKSKQNEVIGLIDYYKNSNGLAIGKSISFFTKGVRIKCWGLKRNGFSVFSVQYCNRWHTYAGDDYVFSASILETGGIRVLVRNAKTKGICIEFAVFKN